MAGSHLILALNAQRAPGGGGGRRHRAFAESDHWKKLPPAPSFKYDIRSSGSHRGFGRIDLH